ncbi:hypothetical protein ACSBM8_01870 [Sphingomonas sp. ASY06-1R]|jgi:hypothetical protein|uniref:hypothetical protein n=1 Tax=Sphingomonas sp. ASY06-1R TaxID=3445771 RepID=UPI003FA2E4D1
MRECRSMRIASAFLLTAFVAAPGLTAASAPSVPVHYGGSTEDDACSDFGVVAGLDPKGDNYLSVQSGPGGKPYRQLDRVHTDQRLLVCEEKGMWLGVVYSKGHNDADCGVTSPRAQRAAYRGPCRSGWVYRKYVMAPG